MNQRAMQLPVSGPPLSVKAKEGTLHLPNNMKKYLSNYLKRYLTKEEREALFKEHPRP